MGPADEVGSRERKREERRKRKERGAASASGNGATEDPKPPSRSELKNQEARENLEPLASGERPTVVTIGAVISGLIALSIVVAYVVGAHVNGKTPPVTQLIVPTFLMGMMSYGMWRARYWAVLGFQVVLVFLILGAAFGLLQAANVAQVLGNCVLLAVAGTLFYRMVKAMARIQMPERTPRR